MKTIVWLSDSPLRGSSFGVVSNELLSRLSSEYKIYILALGYTGIPLNLGGFTILPLDNTTQIDFYNRHVDRDLTIVFHSFYLLDKLDNMTFPGRSILYIPVEGERIPSRYVFPFMSFDRILTPSNYSAEVLRKEKIKADVVYHGVDSLFFKKGSKPDKHMFGFIGLNDLRKQIPRLVEAYSRLKMKDPNLLMCTTMDGHYNPNEIAKDFRVEPTFLENKAFNIPMTREHIRDLYHRIKAYVQCSSEAFGLPSLEAASCELPNIALDHGASKEILGQSSLYAKTTTTLETNLGPIGIVDIDDLVDKMFKLKNDRKLRRDLGRLGRKIAEKFTWEKAANSLNKIIVEELSNE